MTPVAPPDAEPPASLKDVAPTTLPVARIKSTSNQRTDILAMTWPVVLGQLMANAVPLIDVLMLGRLGTPTLAAVGYASQFLALLQALLLAIGAACVALMARAIGAGDVPRAKRAFAATLLLAVGMTAILTLLTLIFPRELLHLLAVQDSIIHLAVPYFRLTLLASLPMAVAIMYEHAFRASRDTFGPMLITGAVAALKIGLNALLIFGPFGLPRMGLIGAGIATCASQLVGFALFLWVSRRHEHPAARVVRADLAIDRAALREAVSVTLPAVGERLVMNAALLTYFRFLGNYGVEAVAAYNVGVRILAFTWIPGVGLSVAAATLVGQALGAGDPHSARKAGWEATRVGLLIAVTLGAFFVFFRVPLALVFTDDPKVVADLDPFILLLGLALPCLVTHFTLAGALRGAGDTMSPLKSAAFGNWVFRVPLGYLFAVVWELDLFWVWSIMLIDHTSRAIWLLWVFRYGAWDKQVGASFAPAPRSPRLAA